MGTDHFSDTACLIPVVALLRAQLPKSLAKGNKDAKPSGEVKQIAALVDFCEKVNKFAKKEKCKTLLGANEEHLDAISKVGAAVLERCKVPIQIKYRVEGRQADGSGCCATASDAAEARANIEKTWPGSIVEQVTEVYSADGTPGDLVEAIFVDPDVGYDDFFGEKQLYYRVAKKSLWNSAGKPTTALKCLAEELGLAVDALMPVTWVTILY
jgi:hypothetical protein